MGKPIGYNPARLQRAYLLMIGTEWMSGSAARAVACGVSEYG